MAGRIRSIKPELLQLPAFAGLTDGAARLFLGMYTLVDDFGRCPAEPAFLLGQVFFGRPRAVHVVGQLLAELARAGLVVLYAERGARYAELAGWREKGSATYQLISHPQPARYPAPSSSDSASDHGTIPRRDQEQVRTDPIRDPNRSERDPARTRAIPQPAPGPAPAPAVTPPRPEPKAYDPEDPYHRGQLTERTYRRVSDARIQLAAELGLPAPLPFPPITPGTRPRGYRDLGDRIREEGAAAPVVCDRVVEAIVAQGRAERDIEWVSEKTFTEGGWAHARNGARSMPRRADPQPAPLRLVGPANDKPQLGANASAWFGTRSKS